MKKQWKAIVVLALWVVVCSGCSRLTVENVNHALISIDESWNASNEQIEREIGVKRFRVDQATCYQAALTALDLLGFSLLQERPELGIVVGNAPAPRPLTQDEWSKTKPIGEAQLKHLASQLLPGLERHLWLNEEDVDFQIALMVVPEGSSTEVSIGFTQIDHKIPLGGVYVMKEAPPSTVMTSILKFWTAYEAVLKQIRAKQPKNDPGA